MSIPTLTVGSQVRRVTSPTDAANGRTGEVIEVNNLTRRFRVLWRKEANGQYIGVAGKRKVGGIRTWVTFKGVEPL